MANFLMEAPFIERPNTTRERPANLFSADQGKLQRAVDKLQATGLVRFCCSAPYGPIKLMHDERGHLIPRTSKRLLHRRRES